MTDFQYIDQLCENNMKIFYDFIFGVLHKLFTFGI